MLNVTSDVKQTLRQNFVTSCIWLLKPIDGHTSFFFRSQQLGKHRSRKVFTLCLCCWGVEGVMLVSYLCKSGCADDPLIESVLLLVLQSNLNIAHAMLTLMQCLHVDSTVRCQADEAPEFRYIMLFAAEIDPWTNKPLLSNLRLRDTKKARISLHHACSADGAKLFCSWLLDAIQAVLDCL